MSNIADLFVYVGVGETTRIDRKKSSTDVGAFGAAFTTTRHGEKGFGFRVPTTVLYINVTVMTTNERSTSPEASNRFCGI